MIDSCCRVNQSKYVNNSIKDCDWLILACSIREQSTADDTFTPYDSFTPLENLKFGLKIQPNAWGNYSILAHKQIKRPGMCSVLL